MQSGRNYFIHIFGRSDTEKKILALIAKYGKNAIVSKSEILEQYPQEGALYNLVQHELLEELTPDGYRFQVEIIRRWFV